MTTKKQKVTTATIRLESVKDPDGWGELQEALGLSAAKIAKHFEYGEYANVELVVDRDLNIVGGRILPR